jgi:enoyl reductase
MTTAVVFDGYGPPEVLRFAQRPDAGPGPGEVRVRVRAAGVQPFDAGVRRGAMADRVPVAFPQTLGNEYAGVVDAVGAGVAGLAVGDAVAGSAFLTAYATEVVVPADAAVPVPDGVGAVAAAALVAAAQTAAGALDELDVAAGDVLLVHGAAGAVGTVAVQLARRRGAVVVGTASPGNHDHLRSLGAVPVAYGPGLVRAVRDAAPGGVDAALDAAGAGSVAASVALGVPRDRIGTIVDDRAAAEHGTRVVRVRRSPARLAAALDLAARGELVVPVTAYPFADVVAAHRDLDTGHSRGKRVLVLP